MKIMRRVCGFLHCCKQGLTRKMHSTSQIFETPNSTACGVETKSNFLRRFTMWTKPEVTEMRFGFEVTMYVCNR